MPKTTFKVIIIFNLLHCIFELKEKGNKCVHSCKPEQNIEINKTKYYSTLSNKL